MGKLYLGDQEIGVYQMEKAEEPLLKFTVDANGKISKGGDVFVLPSNVKDLGPYVFYYACERGTITSADLSSLTTISGTYGAQYMFHYCTSLTSADLSSLTTISGTYGASYMFNRCTELTSVDLSSLTTISGGDGAEYMFDYCSSLVSVDLSSLTTITAAYGAGNMFSNCTSLTSVDLSSLTTVTGRYCMSNMFYNSSNIKDIRFPALTASSFGSYSNQFNNMLSGVTGCTLHFPAAAQARIEKMATYPNFGGTNTTVLFDL